MEAEGSFFLSKRPEGKNILKCIKADLMIDVANKKTVKNPVIIVRGDKIEAVGQERDMRIPKDAVVIDLEKRTLIPGLIDTHVHIRGYRSYGVSERIINYPSFFVIRAVDDCLRLLRAGYTTVRDCGADDYTALSLKKAINEGAIPGPRIFAAGRYISQTGGHGDIHYLSIEEAKKKGVLIADGPDDCRRAAREAIRDGCDFVKIFTTGGVGSEKDHPQQSQFTIEEIKVITDEAHRVGKRVATHAQGAEGVKNAILGKVDTVEHGYFLDDEAVHMMVENRIYFSPTLYLVEVYKKALENPYDMPSWRLKKQQECVEAMPKSFQQALRAGVKIATGTDFTGYPLREHGTNANEPIAMVKYGMSPMDAVVAATKIGAETIGIEDNVGTIEKGKIADIVAVNGNPLEDINALKKVAYVMKEGSTYYIETQ